MTSDKTNEIFVSGASGWLGKELISLISESKLANFSTNDLRLFSSNGRSIKLINSKEYSTSPFELSNNPNCIFFTFSVNLGPIS